MKIDTYDKFKKYVEELNKIDFEGKFYVDEVLDNTFYWECNSNIKFEIIYDWYFDEPSFSIGIDIKYKDKVLEEHWKIVVDKFIDELLKIQNEGIVCIIKKNILGIYSLTDIMYVNEYTDIVKSKYKDNFFNKYFEVFSKDK